MHHRCAAGGRCYSVGRRLGSRRPSDDDNVQRLVSRHNDDSTGTRENQRHAHKPRVAAATAATRLQRFILSLLGILPPLFSSQDGRETVRGVLRVTPPPSLKDEGQKVRRKDSGIIQTANAKEPPPNHSSIHDQSDRWISLSLWIGACVCACFFSNHSPSPLVRETAPRACIAAV